MEVIITDGTDERFIMLCKELDEYLNDAVGGEKQRSQYVQYNQLNHIHDVVLITENDKAVACGSFKEYSCEAAEIKRVFVMGESRGKKYGQKIMQTLENMAKEKGYSQLILETGKKLSHARTLYENLGFERISNYGQYADMPDSVCMRKYL